MREIKFKPGVLSQQVKYILSILKNNKNSCILIETRRKAANKDSFDISSLYPMYFNMSSHEHKVKNYSIKKNKIYNIRHLFNFSKSLVMLSDKSARNIQYTKLLAFANLFQFKNLNVCYIK